MRKYRGKNKGRALISALVVSTPPKGESAMSEEENNNREVHGQLNANPPNSPQVPQNKSENEIGIGTCIVVCTLYFGGLSFGTGNLNVGLCGAVAGGVLGLIIGLIFCRKKQLLSNVLIRNGKHEERIFLVEELIKVLIRNGKHD